MAPNAEQIHKGRIEKPIHRSKGRSRSQSPRWRDMDYRRSRSRSRDRYELERHHGRNRDYHHRTLSRSPSQSHSSSPDHRREYKRGKCDDERRRSSPSYRSVSPACRSPSPQRSPSLDKMPSSRGESPDALVHKERPFTSKSVSPCSEADD